MADDDGWQTLEEWRAGTEYHPNRRLSTFLTNLVVNHRCEVDRNASETHVFLICGCAKAHYGPIEMFPSSKNGAVEDVMEKVRASFPCCAKA